MTTRQTPSAQKYHKIMLNCWAVEHCKGEKALIKLCFCFSFHLSCGFHHLSLLLSCSVGVCFVFPVQSSRSSLCHSWSLRSTERGSSPLFPLARFCPTFPPSKSAFPQCSSMKSTSGRLALRCPRPQAPSGMERPTDTHSDMNPNTVFDMCTWWMQSRLSRFGSWSEVFSVHSDITRANRPSDSFTERLVD